MEKKNKKENKKKVKYVTDTIDVLWYGSSLKGTYYTSYALRPRAEVGADAGINGVKVYSR